MYERGRVGWLTVGWDDIVDGRGGQGCKARKLAGIAVRCVGWRVGLRSIGNASTTRAYMVEGRLELALDQTNNITGR